MKVADTPTSPAWLSCLRLIVLWVALPVLALALLLSYGEFALFLGCMSFIGGLALFTWRVMRSFSLSMAFLLVCAAGVWGFDSTTQYPILRGLQSSVPFGPSITLSQSPSGKTTAYIYNHGFLDSAYAVCFARGHGFPGKSNWIRYDKAADFTITAEWANDVFRVEVDGGPVVLTYSEAENRVLLSN